MAAELDQNSYGRVTAALDLLAEYGPGDGRPLMDTVANSRHGNMKELRPGSSGRSGLRILFPFASARRAIMLIAGDKAGNRKKWYREGIPLADIRLEVHIERLRGGN